MIPDEQVAAAWGRRARVEASCRSGTVSDLLDAAAHTRLLTMGVILLLVLRFSPRGLIPER